MDPFPGDDFSSVRAVLLGVPGKELSTPDRHVALAMLRHDVTAIDHRENAPVGEFAAVLLGQVRQVRWAASTFHFRAMADGT